MGKRSPSPPPAPDPRTLTASQGAANIDAAIDQARLNMINQQTPTGSLTFGQIGEQGGVPQFQATTGFSDMQDWLFRRGEDISAHGLDVVRRQLGNLDPILNRPFDVGDATRFVPNVGLPSLSRSQINFNALPGGGTVPEASDAVRQRVEDALFQRARGQLDPVFEQRQRDLETQLANQGFARSSEGFGREVEDFRRSQDNAYLAALQDAIATGGMEQSRLFGLEADQFGLQEQLRNRGLSEQLAQFGLDAQHFNQQASLFGLGQQARQQAIQEALMERGVPLNEFATMLGQNAGAALPQFSPVPQVSVPAPDVMGATALQHQSQMNAFNQQQQNRQGLMGAVGQLGGAALGAWLSDPEAKTDRSPVSGEDALDRMRKVPVESWRYKGDGQRHIGPMADDFAEAFGGDGHTISPVTAFGMSMAAIQALADKVDRLERA